jgi:4-amino-4-deoxychorismate lyase
MTDPDYFLFTSLRYDPQLIITTWNQRSPLLLESYHVERLKTAAKKLNWRAAIQLTESADFPAKFRAICKDAVNNFEGEQQVVLV